MLLGTKLVFAFFPKRCYFTNRVLWLEYVYKQTHMYTGPGDPVFEYFYYDIKSFLVNKIKGEV